VTLFDKFLTGVVMLALGCAARMAFPVAAKPTHERSPAAQLAMASSSTRLMIDHAAGAPNDVVWESDVESIDPEDDEPVESLVLPSVFVFVESPLTTGLGIEARPPRLGRVAVARPMRC
jgi:hypothetical protein